MCDETFSRENFKKHVCYLKTEGFRKAMEQVDEE
jgi:hypothetical protein